MAFGIDDILIGLAIGAAAGGASAALAPKGPGTPDYNAASRAGVDADLETLPYRRKIEQAARMGTKVKADIKQKPVYAPYIASDWQPGGKYYGKTELLKDGKPQLIGGTTKQNAIYGLPGTKTGQQVLISQGGDTTEYDFTGRGDIDNEIYNAQRNAQTALDVSKKYSADFIKEALAQEKLADPEGAQARELLTQRVMEGADRQPDTTLSDTVRKQIMDQLAAKQGLDGQQTEAVQRAMLARQAMGDTASPELSSTFTRGAAGLQRQAQRQGRAQSYLSSGATPTDIKYRSSQQSMANLGAFINGQTPVTQFGQLSGAQQGATPIKQGATLPTVNPNAGSQGASYALGNYQQNMNQYSQQANPWMAGMGLALKGAGAYAAGK